MIYRFAAEDKPTNPIKLKVEGLLPLKSEDAVFWLATQKEVGQIYSQKRLEHIERAAYKNMASLNDRAICFINRHDENLCGFDFKAFSTQAELAGYHFVTS